MKIPRQAYGVPFHPLLVHFPIAFWTAALIFDCAAMYYGADPWWPLAHGATIAGLVIGALAIATGLLEYLEPSVAGIDIRLAARHGVRTTLAWCVFAAKMIFVWNVADAAAGSIAVCIGLDVVGCILLAQGVYFGTKQIYQQLEARQD